MLDIIPIPRPIHSINTKEPKNFVLISPKKFPNTTKNTIFEHEESESKNIFVKIIPPQKSPPELKNLSIEIQEPSSVTEEQNNIERESYSQCTTIIHLVAICVHVCILIIIMTQVNRSNGV